MAHLSSIYFKLDTLETLVNTLKQKGEKGIAITLSTNDEANQYGQNISGYVSQSKEDRESGKPKFYVTNGRTVWSNTDGVFVPPYEGPNSSGVQDAVIVDGEDNLPF